jgi:hypothetical protein
MNALWLVTLLPRTDSPKLSLPRSTLARTHDFQSDVQLRQPVASHTGDQSWTHLNYG